MQLFHSVRIFNTGFFHLGAYRQSNSCPCPILVKLNRSIDVINILAKQASYPSNIVIKPDLPPEEHNVQKILLSERWRPIQSGTERTSIKIRKSSIYISGKLYGKVTNQLFCIDLKTIRPIHLLLLLLALLFKYPHLPYRSMIKSQYQPPLKSLLPD